MFNFNFKSTKRLWISYDERLNCKEIRVKQYRKLGTTRIINSICIVRLIVQS